jgi:N utilization substance protein A
VVEALGGEPIDLIPFTDQAPRYVCHALAPAPIQKIYVDDEARVMELVVPDGELEGAIGPGAVNLRLAAQLVGWQLDVYSASRDAEGA